MTIFALKSKDSSKSLQSKLTSVVKGIYRKTVIIIGQKQSGKTTFLKFLLRRLPKPVIAVDMVGRLSEYCETEDIDAYLISVNSWSQQLWNAIQRVLKNRDMIVIECKGMLQTEKAQFMDKLARSLTEYHRFVMIVDEIHEIIPERQGQRALEFERLIRTGGNRQIGFIMTTQRPQIVTKDILSLADEYVFFRVVYGGDLAILRDLLKYHLASSQDVERELREIQALQTGQSKVYSFVSDKANDK